VISVTASVEVPDELVWLLASELLEVVAVIVEVPDELV
jgi:hypothetical protein